MGNLVSQFVNRPTLDLTFIHDRRVMRSTPHWAWNLLEILSPSAFPRPCPSIRMLSLWKKESGLMRSGVDKQGSLARPGPLPDLILVNEVLLEYSLAYLFTCCLWLCLCSNSRTLSRWNLLKWSTKPQILSRPLQKKCANPWLRFFLFLLEFLS